jgi:hypothetical protein
MIHNPFSGLAALRSRASVPSFGGNGAGDSVNLALQRVAVAERNLQAAREGARSAARQAGVDLVGLFSEGAFIARATGERWRDEGFEAGRRKGEKVMADIFGRTVATDARDPNSKFHHLAKRLQKIRPEDWPDHVAKMRGYMNSAGPRWERMREAGYFDAVEAGDHEKAAEIYRAANPELSAQSKGEAILAAGRRARMSGDAAGEIPEPQGLAKQIIEAGKKARRPTGTDE